VLDKHIQTVPVVDDGVLVGVLSRRDVLRCVARRELTSAAGAARRMHRPHSQRPVSIPSSAPLPCPLGLVTVYSADPAQLGRCHQVLAYAYQWRGAYFRVGVYDPNSPVRDDIHIGLDTSNPGRTTAFDHNVNIADPIRGFFCSAYSFSDPSAIAGASLAA
jgi:hypothetical protein